MKRYKTGEAIKVEIAGLLGFIPAGTEIVLEEVKEECNHLCTGNCRRVGCRCKCGEWHEEEIKPYDQPLTPKDHQEVLDRLKTAAKNVNDEVELLCSLRNKE